MQHMMSPEKQTEADAYFSLQMFKLQFQTIPVKDFTT